jgi:hypothetical protein
MMKSITTLVLLGVTVGVPRIAWADNTTSAFAYSLMIGGTPAEAAIPMNGSRWYWTFVVAGRSYCVETQGGVHFDTGGSFIDTVATVYGPDATTVIGTNGDLALVAEPGGGDLSRVCFIADTSQYVFLEVRARCCGWVFNVRLRMVETTLFSNWFFVGADYAAYTLPRNTTSQVVAYTLNWRNGSGTIVATTSGALAGNAGTFVNARDFAGALAAVSGTVEVAHAGSPGAIMASTTVLSGTTGLSFDAPFVGIMGRQPW